MLLQNMLLDDMTFSPNSLNSLSPYIGRLRPECAQFLIDSYADPQKPIFDPFCGSGTVLLQGWINQYDVYGNDMSPYAYVLSLGKLFPYPNECMAQETLDGLVAKVNKYAKTVNLDLVPEWVREFYHPDTLKEIIAWVHYLKRNREWFLLSSLLGILHHQRPAFLSYPASHGAPYLRVKKYPKEQYPEMYTYRNVYSKLSAKVCRTYKQFPTTIDLARQRVVFNKNAATMRLQNLPTGTIITSPPYMRSLTYARDNRLRLWFLGENHCDELDQTISPRQKDFITMMERCFRKWAKYQTKGDRCVVVIGDLCIKYNGEKVTLPQLIEWIAKDDYLLIEAYQDPIPESKKLVKGHDNIKREVIVALERK